MPSDRRDGGERGETGDEWGNWEARNMGDENETYQTQRENLARIIASAFSFVLES